MRLFSKDWVRRFEDAWNRRTIRTKLKDTGPIGFRVLSDGVECGSCVLTWNLHGDVSASQEIPDRWFIAEEKDWNEFVAGAMSSVVSVMSGRIQYLGDTPFLFRQGRHFDDISVVVRSVAI